MGVGGPTSGCLGRPPRIAAEAAEPGHGAGTNRWEAGHALRIGRLERPALGKAPSSHPYAAAEVGTTVGDRPHVGRHLNVSTEQAAEHFKGLPLITPGAGLVADAVQWER
jgi:hypothetical protein